MKKIALKTVLFCYTITSIFACLGGLIFQLSLKELFISLTGIGIFFLTNFYFMLRCLRNGGSEKAKTFLASFYIFEIKKIILNIFFLTIMMCILDYHLACCLLLGFIFSIACYFFVPLIYIIFEY